MTEEKILATFAALSNQTRLRILKTLVKAGPQGLPAGDIAMQIGATPSRASFHLSTMAEAGLLQFERSARSITYRVDFQAMGAVLHYLLHDCCAGHPEVEACCRPRS
jgi:DNA-binding transcriptional ArsR family regulator